MPNVVRNLSTRVSIDGEAEWKQKAASINSELKTLGSQLKLVESQFAGQANSMAALTAKGSALSDLYQKQQQKVTLLADALKNAQNAQQTYSNRVSEANSKIAAAEQELSKLKNSTGDTTAAQKKLTDEIDRQKAELSEAERYYSSATAGVNNWQQKLNNAKVDLNNLDQEIKKNDQYLGEAKTATDGCATSIDKYGKETKQAADESGEFGEKASGAVDSLASALAAAGVTATISQITQALKACTDSFEEFEYGIAKIQTIANVSTDALSSMSESITKLSDETGVSTADLNEAVYQAVSAGVNSAKAVEFVSNAVKLSEGGFTTATSAVDVLTTAINAYGLSADDAAKISDILITTQNLGKTTVDKLAQSMGDVIPIAAGLNTNIANVSAAYAVLTKNGVSTETAGTYLRAMLNNLSDDASKTADVLKTETGKSFADLMEEGYSLGDVLKIIDDSVSGNGTAFKNLFGEVRAGTGALSIMNSGAENFNNVLQSMETSTGAASSAFATMEDTSEHADKVFQTSAKNLETAIGSQLTPALTSLRESGADAFEWATDYVKENPQVVSAITALIAVIGTLGIAITGYSVAVQIVIPLIKAFNVAVAASPAAIVAVALAALTSAVIAYAISMPDANQETNDFVDGLSDEKDAAQDATDALGEQTSKNYAMVESLNTLSAKENKTVADKSAILSLVDKLNTAVPELALAYDSEADSLNLSADAIKRAAKAQAEKAQYDAKVERLTTLYTEQAEIAEKLADAEEGLAAARAEVEGYKGVDNLEGWQAVEDAEKNVKLLTEAQQENTSQLTDANKVIDEYADAQNSAATSNGDFSGTVDSLSSQLSKIELAYDTAKTTALDSLNQQISKWEEMDNSAVTSAADVLKALQSQIDWLANYQTNLDALQSRKIPGVDTSELVQSLSDGSTESAAILAGLKTSTDEQVSQIVKSMSKVTTGKDSLSSDLAEVTTKADKALDDLTSKVNDTAKELNVSDVALQSGKKTVQGYIDGLNSKLAELQTAANNVKSVMSGTGTTTTTKSTVDGSHASGLDYVPFDGYTAELHRGERILTAAENSNLGNLNLSTASRVYSETSVNHSGTIRVEGINSEGQLEAVKEILMEDLRNEVRML